MSEFHRLYEGPMHGARGKNVKYLSIFEEIAFIGHEHHKYVKSSFLSNRSFPKYATKVLESYVGRIKKYKL